MLVAVFLMIFSFMAAGCPSPQQSDTSTAAVEEIDSRDFTWDTVRRLPRWRFGSSIQWHRTGERATVIGESRENEKAIFCYISRYDSDVTATIEDGVFNSDAWGQEISDNLIAWEIDWWENPELAQEIIGFGNAPALFMLVPSGDESSEEFRVVDRWEGDELLKFPLHDELLPFENPLAIERIEYFWEIGMQPEDNVPGDDGIQSEINPDPEEFTFAQRKIISVRLADGQDVSPEECLYVSYGYRGDEAVTNQVINRVDSWGAYLDAIGPDLIWMPDDAFIEGSGWAIDPNRTIKAALCATAVDTDWPFDYAGLMNAIRAMLTSPSRKYIGGFPAYFDIRSTLEEGPQYIDDDSPLPPLVHVLLEDPMKGPRDIAWVNARTMASIIEIFNADPELVKLPFHEDRNVGEFFEPMCNIFFSAILEKAGNMNDLKLHERVYILDLLNRMYQRSGDILLLEMAGEIASEFPPENPEEWFDPHMYPFLPDLAIALHHYGWLAEDEAAREAADYITEEIIQYATSFGRMDQVRIAYAYDIVHAKCLHIGIVSSLEDETGIDLLVEALHGWDPAKVAQILDPERDAELIEHKGYTDMGQAAAFVCIDDMCYMPAKNIEDLRETIRMVYEDLASEAE